MLIAGSTGTFASMSCSSVWKNQTESLVRSPWGSRQPEPFFDRQTKIYAVSLLDGERFPFLPDDELFRLAAEKKLHEPDVLASQVDRKLDDEKSDRFLHDFLDQWLGLEEINTGFRLMIEGGESLKVIVEPQR